MKYIVYKITNNINSKIYIGAHKTENVDDNYMGSGMLLKKAISKYGIENFSKEVLEIFENSEDMFNMESILVNKEFINSNETYNIKEGGYGGFDHISKETRHRLGSENFKGKQHSDVTKKKIGEANSINQKGEKNSRYGTAWYVQKEASNIDDKKSFKKGQEPKGYITTTEWRDNNKRKSGLYGSSWYNDGVKSYLKKKGDDVKGLVKGRLSFTK